jgi:Collagen triple helix repeat (20 copies)
MLSSFRNRFGIPGVISVIALVFTMLGGAYAASNDGGAGKATASAKKGPRGPRGPKGPAGPAGPQGPAGPAGAKGDKGDTGTAGSNGSNGAAGPTGKTGPTGAPGVTGTAGVTGPTGPTGPYPTVLPSGGTLKGTWSTGLFVNEAAFWIDWSFPIPLAVAPTKVTMVKKDGTSVFPGGDKTKCPGSAANPEAVAGNMCIYTFEEPAEVSSFDIIVTKFGVIRQIVYGENTVAGKSVGTWAVTAP